MMKGWAITILVSWTCCAQKYPQTPAEVEADLESQLRGLVERRVAPLGTDLGPERPTGESISVYGLQHKVPKAARKSFARAKKLSKSGEHGGAAAELESTVQIDPVFAAAYGRLGVEYGLILNFDKAKTALERAVELDPDSWTAQYNLGVALLHLGDLAGAERSARRALQNASEEAGPHWLLGYVLYRREEARQEALQHMRYAARTIKEAKQFLEIAGQ